MYQCNMMQYNSKNMQRIKLRKEVMMKKYIALLTMVFLLAACSNGESDSASTTDESQATVESTEASEAESMESVEMESDEDLATMSEESLDDSDEEPIDEAAETDENPSISAVSQDVSNAVAVGASSVENPVPLGEWATIQLSDYDDNLLDAYIRFTNIITDEAQVQSEIDRYMEEGGIFQIPETSPDGQARQVVEYELYYPEGDEYTHIALPFDLDSTESLGPLGDVIEISNKPVDSAMHRINAGETFHGKLLMEAETDHPADIVLYTNHPMSDDSYATAFMGLK